jgi:hypothetical protein
VAAFGSTSAVPHNLAVPDRVRLLLALAALFLGLVMHAPVDAGSSPAHGAPFAMAPAVGQMGHGGCGNAAHGAGRSACWTACAVHTVEPALVHVWHDIAKAGWRSPEANHLPLSRILSPDPPPPKRTLIS